MTSLVTLNLTLNLTLNMIISGQSPSTHHTTSTLLVQHAAITRPPHPRPQYPLQLPDHLPSQVRGDSPVITTWVHCFYTRFPSIRNIIGAVGRFFQGIQRRRISQGK